MTEPYHRFVFDRGRLVGEFEAMYQAEPVEGFDSWHQDDLSRRPEILQLLHGRHFDSVLDIGCGKGALLSVVDADRVVGVDISPTALVAAQERIPGGEFRCREALQATDPGERFDLVMLVAVLYYVREWKQLLELAANVGTCLLVWAYVPADTVGTIGSIRELREQVVRLFSVQREVAANDTWGALAGTRARSK